MASNINYLSINENFPVAGQDNDTQVFRDNFDTIKTNFRNAKDEITSLQDNTAKTNVDNDFELSEVTRAVFRNNRTKKFDAGAVTASPTTIDFENGEYQIFRVGADINMDFLNFPGDPVLTGETATTVGKVVLELYSDGSSRTVTFSTSGGTVIKKDASFPDPFTLTSNTDPVFVEVWRHNDAVIYMRYLGAFS